MTTRPDTQPRAARTWHWLALPILLLAGCVSVPPTTPVLAPEAPPVVVATPAAVAAGAVGPGRPASPPRRRPTSRSPRRCRSIRCARKSASTSTTRAARVDLWERVRRGFAMPDLDSDLVRDRERWYATRPDYVARMTERGGRYLFHIVEELDKRGMPTELALLPFIESAYNPQAMSVARASGMWQFIPSTGRDFELKQNVFRDDRRDVLASTRAALDYLQKLHGMFGDWHLALAAYNWGEGSVQRAIAKNQRAGLPTDYMSLRMPAETQYYVPKLQAVKNIVSRPASFNLQLPELYNHPYFLSVPIEHDIDVVLAIRLAGMTSEEFQNLNPQMNRPVILAAGTPQILLPYDNANRFVRELPQHRGPLTTLDDVDRAEDDEVGRSGARRRHVGRGVPRSQSHPGAHGHQGGIDAARAAPQRDDRRRLEHRRRQRDDHARPRRAAVAQGGAARRQERQRRLRRQALSRQRGAGRAVERRRHRRQVSRGADDRRLRSRTRRGKRRPRRRHAAAARAARSATRVAKSGTAKGSKPTKTTVTHKHGVAKN